MVWKRTACLLVCASRGNLTETNAVIRKTLRRLSLTGEYLSSASLRRDSGESGLTPRWLVPATDEEFTLLMETLAPQFEALGWEYPPLDCYHD